MYRYFIAVLTWKIITFKLSLNYFFTPFQTFYREIVDPSRKLRANVNSAGQNLFMPNFTTMNSINEDENSQKSSIISNWDQLQVHDQQPIEDDDDDEVFSEMRPTQAPASVMASDSPRGK